MNYSEKNNLEYLFQKNQNTNILNEKFATRFERYFHSIKFRIKMKVVEFFSKFAVNLSEKFFNEYLLKKKI